MGVIKRQGIKNIFITYVGVIIGAVSAIFIQPAFLTTTELGFTRNLYNFSFLMSLALPLGLPNIILRFFSHYKQNVDIKRYFFGFILIYFLASSLFVLLIFFLFKGRIIELYKVDSELFIAYFLCVIPYSLIISFNTVMTSFSQAVYKSTVPSFLNDVFSRILVVLITVLYFYKIIAFNQYVLLFILIYFLVSIILVFYLLQFGLVSFKINRNALRQIELKKLFPYGLALCVISFTSYGLKSIDSIFIGTTSLSNVAIYSTAVFLALFIEVPLGAIERISHSKIAESFSDGNYAEIDKIYFESVKYLLIFGGFIFLGINACSKYIFEFLPAEYSKSIHLIQILSFGCLVNVSTGVNTAIVFYTSHFKAGGLLLVSAFVITVILDVIFIPIFGMTGAAIITTGVSIVYNISKFLFIYNTFKFQPYNFNSLKVSILIFVGFIIVLFMPAITNSAILNIIINGCLISTCYIFCIYKLNVIPEFFSGLKTKFL